jgi:hypothetical protein
MMSDANFASAGLTDGHLDQFELLGAAVLVNTNSAGSQ